MSDTELDNDKNLATFSLIDWVPKFFGVTVTFVYLVGFLVVVCYLSRYGVSSLEVFQLQYLVAGAWVVVPIAALALMRMASDQFERHAFSQTSEGKPVSWRRRLAVSSVSGIPVSFAWGVVIGFGGWAGLSIRTGVLSWIFYIALTFAGSLLWISWKAPGDLKHTWLHRRTVPFYGTGLFVIFFAYVFFFAVKIYPLIPYSLGGGKPLTVVLLLGDKQIPGILAKDASSHLSIPYKLLEATDKAFVVLPTDPSQESIEFSRAAVLGVEVLKDSPDKSDSR